VFQRISECESLNRDTIFILKSTVVPETTLNLSKQFPDLKIIFNPEFLTERSARLDFINASRIVLGGPEELCDRVEHMYRVRFPHTKIVKTDSTTAEFIKYMCNTFFATKISFMNEFKQLSNKLNLDWDKAMEGFVSDGRIGNSHLDVPGHDGSVGFGGKCFPKDLNAMINFFVSNNVDPKILTAAWEKNLEVRDDHDWKDIEGATS
jgi:UDPglucose 6-dehydrogenase